MDTVQLSDIVKLAIDIERKGTRLYTALAEKYKQDQEAQMAV